MQTFQIAYTQLPTEDRGLKDALIEHIDARALERLHIETANFVAWLKSIPALAVDLALNMRCYSGYVPYTCNKCNEGLSTNVEPKWCAHCGKKGDPVNT